MVFQDSFAWHLAFIDSSIAGLNVGDLQVPFPRVIRVLDGVFVRLNVARAANDQRVWIRVSSPHYL